MRFHPRNIFQVLLLSLLTAACSPANYAQSLPVIHASEATPLATLPPTATQIPATHTPQPTATSLPSPTPTQPPSPTPTPETVNFTGAGDIAVCGTQGAERTAALLAQIPGDVFTAGDNSNEDGAAQQYTDCFGSTWGQFMSRIHPSPGNHDYMTEGAADYYRYFGAAAGEPGKGYYSFDAGAWHVVMLNGNCAYVSCDTHSEQVLWLRQDLAAHPAKCTLAIWHQPRFSSGLSGTSGMYPFWQALYENGADLVINGHDHDYERFAPQDPLGNPDPERGIREFVVGTGGASQRGFLNILPTSEAHNTGTYGVLKLTLAADSYDWQFIPVEGGDFTDSGSGVCH